MSGPQPVSRERLEDGLKARIDGVVELVSCDRLSGGANQETYRVSQFDGGVNGRIYGAGAYGRSLKPSRMTNVLIVRNGVNARDRLFPRA